MATILVTDWPAESRSSRAMVRVARIAGSVLMAVAAVASVPAVWIAFGGLVELVSRVAPGDDPLPFVSAAAWRVLLVVLAVSVVTYVVARNTGRRLLRVGRHEVLFLRRFGHTSATHAVTDAAARIGADWRHITLDDKLLAPVGVGTGALAASRTWGALSRLASLAFRLFKVMAALVIVAFVGAAIAAVVAIVFGSATAGAAYEFLLQAALAGSAVVAGNMLYLLFLVLALFPAIGFVSVAMDSVGDADEARRMRIDRAQDISSVRDRARRAAGALFGARLVVVSVDGSIWQPTVTGFAVDAAAAVIDVSAPSDNLLWEIELLTTRVARPCVFIAERSQVESVLDAPADAVQERLAALLDGRSVLTYTTDPVGIRQFRRALRRTLASSVAQAGALCPHPTQSPAVSLDEPVTSLTYVVRPGQYDFPHDWTCPRLDSQAVPELGQGERLLLSTELSWFREMRGDEHRWLVTTGVHIYLTSERVIWVARSAPACDTVLAGQLRHIWLLLVLYRRPRRLRDRTLLDRTVMLNLTGRAYGEPPLKFSVEFGVDRRRVRRLAERILVAASNAIADTWSRTLPPGHKLLPRTPPTGRLRRRGPVRAGSYSAPTYIGTHVVALPEGDPNRLSHVAHPDGPPPTPSGWMVPVGTQSTSLRRPGASN